ncbi:MAG: hypothetical protein ACO3IT_07355 [Ilumatobacteraceae bacterium]
MASNLSLNVVIAASIDKLKAGLKSAVDAVKQSAPPMQAEAQKAGKAIEDALGGTNLRAASAELREQITIQRQALSDLYKDLAAKEEMLARTSKSNFAGQKALQTQIAKLKAEIKGEEMAMRDLQNQSASTNAELANGGRVAEQNTQAAEAMSRAVNALSMAMLLVSSDNETLNKAMQGVRVAMALASAAVAVYNLSLRENQVLAKVNIALQKAWAMVVGQTTGAMKVLRATMASLGIMAVVAALGYLISALTDAKDSTEELEQAQAYLNRQLSKNKSEYDSQTKALQRQLDLDVARAQLAGKTEAEILKIRQDSLKEQIKAEKDARLKLGKTQLDAENIMIKQMQDAGESESAINTAKYDLYTKQMEERLAFDQRILDLEHQAEMLGLNASIDVMNEKAAKQKQLNEELQRLAEQRAQFEKNMDREAVLSSMEGIEQKRQRLAFEYVDRIAQAKALGADLVAVEQWYQNEQALIDAEAEANAVTRAQNHAAELEAIKEKHLQNALKMFDVAQNVEMAAEARNRAQGIIDEETYQQRLLEIQKNYLQLQIDALEAAGLDASKLRLQLEMLSIGKGAEAAADSMQQFSNAANQAFQNLQVNLIDEFAQSIGDLFSYTGEGMQGFGKKMLGVIANFLRQLGRLMIAAGTASKAFRESLATNPGVAIAAGVAALTTAAAIQAQLNNTPEFAKGGIVSGPTLGIMGEYPGASSNPEVIAPLDKLQSMLDIGGGGNGYIAETRIDGRDLFIVLNRYQKDSQRG